MEMVETVNAATEALTEAVTEAVTEAASSGILFEPLNFVSNLKWMGLGMLGIFLVIAAIWGVTVVLNKFCKEKPKTDEEN